MTYTVKRKLVLVSMLVLMLLMLVPFEALAQSIVVSSMGTQEYKHSWQERSFYGAGRQWAFFMDASSYLCFRSSADNGVTWSATTQVKIIKTPGDVWSGSWVSYQDAFSIYWDGTYVHTAAATDGYADRVEYQRGTPNSNGTITWTANQVNMFPGLSSSGFPSVTVDTSGRPWVGASACGGGGWVTRSSTTDGTWSTDAGFPYQVTSGVSGPTNECGWLKIVALTSNKMVAIMVFVNTDTHIFARRYTGTAWGGFAKSANSVVVAATPRYTSWDCVAQDDNVHIVYLETTSYDIQYVKYQYSTNSFVGDTQLYAAATTTSSPAIIMDSANNLHVFWENDPTDDHMFYAKYVYDESTWVSYYDLITELDGLPSNGYYLNADYTCDESHVGVYYVAGSTILKFKLLSEVFVVNTLTASPVGLTSATLKGEIVSLGFGSADERGFVLNDSPTLVGAWLEGNETGTFNVGVFTHGVTGLDMFSTYWYAAYAENAFGIEYGNWTSFDTVVPIPTPSSGNVTGDTATICSTTAWNFLAMPITNTDIKLTWDWYPTTGNSSVQISIRYDLYHYPGNTTDGTLIYQGTSDVYTHTNLIPGTTYYYRGWLLCGGNYSADYVEDWATTYGSSPVVSPPEQPGGWFQDPSCTAYGKIPLLSDALTAINSGYGFPMTTICVMFTLLWIIILGFVIFLFIHSAMMMVITIAVLIILASIMGLLPLWMIVMTICLGGISIYVSSRT